MACHQLCGADADHFNQPLEADCPAGAGFSTPELLAAHFFHRAQRGDDADQAVQLAGERRQQVGDAERPLWSAFRMPLQMYSHGLHDFVQVKVSSASSMPTHTASNWFVHAQHAAGRSVHVGQRHHIQRRLLQRAPMRCASRQLLRQLAPFWRQAEQKGPRVGRALAGSPVQMAEGGTCRPDSCR